MGRRITRAALFVAVGAAAQFAAACGDAGAGVRVLGTVAPEFDSALPPGTTSVFSTAGTDGRVFLDPQGTYTITISSDWSPMSGVAADGIEFWALDASQVGFADNVNVLTQDAPDMDLDDYMTVSAANMGGLQVLDRYTVIGTNGNELGVLESEGMPFGAATDTPIHFLTVVDVLDEVAIVATLSATLDSFEARRAIAEPYLLTLQAT